MKIAIATTTSFHLGRLASELIEMGHDVTYYSYHPEYRIKKEGIKKENYRSLFYRLLPFSACALFKYAPKLQYSSVEKMLDKCDKLVANKLEYCDYFIGLSGMCILSSEVAKNKYNAKVIIDRGSQHVLVQAKLIENKNSKGLTDNYISRELNSYGTADIITVPSIQSRITFENNSISSENIFLNNYGVDLNRFEPTIGPGLGKRALFIGAWSYQKGVDLLTKSLDEISDLYITHIGAKIDVEFPESTRFKSLGFIKNNELINEMRKADFLILPSRQDGFGMVLLEALACGVPVIASNMTGGPDIKKVITEKKYVEVFESGSLNSLIESIERMKLVSIFPENEPRVILNEEDKKYYSWKSYAERYSNFLLNLK